MRCSETPELADPQTGNEAGTRVTLKVFWMHLHEGRSLFAIQ
jgi:hypothetical protein